MDPIQALLAAKDGDFNPGPFSGSPVKLTESVTRDPGYRRFIEAYNGLYAFGRALHIFGWSEALDFHDIRNRNRAAEWRRLYGEAAVGLVFFAEEVFGNQYAFSREGIVFFDVESAERELVARDFNDWVHYVVNDVDYATGRPVADEWTATHGPIPFGTHLIPKTPFLLGGAYHVDNLRVVPWEGSLLFRADIARQIKDLPDGTDVEITER